jgi:hypothetical protein
MVLSSNQVRELKSAIDGYDYPAKLWDFEQNKPLIFKNMRELEYEIRADLLSNDQVKVRFALANVVYWGFASTGLAGVRSRKFLEGLKEEHIKKAARLFRNFGQFIERY